MLEVPLPVFGGVGGSSGIWRRFKRVVETRKKKKKKKKKKEVRLWSYTLEFTPTVEEVSVEGDSKYYLSMSSQHKFIPATLDISIEPSRQFKINFDIAFQFDARIDAIRKDDEDVIVALLMTLGKD